MPTEIKFGTDGWRAIIAGDYTFDNVRICAQAVADYLHESGLAKRGLVIGYDTRFASEHFAAAVAEVIAANGIRAYLCNKATPTPAISYSIVAKGAGGAAIITASHNPALWNGFKYKPEYAGSASPEVIAALEGHILRIQSSGGVKQMDLAEAREQGWGEYFDPTPSYFRQLSTLVDLEALRGSGLKVVVDSMYGAATGYLKTLLSGGKTRVVEIHAERNPLFPGLNPEPIMPHLAELSSAVQEKRASVGLATDGDGDRIGVIDEKGAFINQLQVFALLILYLLEVKGGRGPIVKSLTTTSMAYRLGQLFGVPVYETPVGFKHIGPKMIAEQALIGGEESGGFGFRGHIPERDGILAGLYLLDLMIKLNKTPSQLIEYLYAKVGPHYYDRVDLSFLASERQAIIQRISNSKPKKIDGVGVIEVDTKDGFRFLLADGSWLLLRFSGTEPVMRIYTETDSPQRVKRLLAEGRRLAGL